MLLYWKIIVHVSMDNNFRYLWYLVFDMFKFLFWRSVNFEDLLNSFVIFSMINLVLRIYKYYFLYLLNPYWLFFAFWIFSISYRKQTKKITFYEPREGRRVGWRFESLLWRRGGGLGSFFIYCFLLNMYMYMYSRHIYMTVIKKNKNIFKIFWIDAFFSYLYKTLFTIFSIYYSIKVNKIEWIKIKHLDNKYKSYQICWNMVFTMQLTVHRETIKTTAAVGCERLV